MLVTLTNLVVRAACLSEAAWWLLSHAMLGPGCSVLLAPLPCTSLSSHITMLWVELSCLSMGNLHHSKHAEATPSESMAHLYPQ